MYVYLDLPWAVTFDQFEVFAEVVAAAEAHFDDLHKTAISNRTQIRAFDAPSQSCVGTFQERVLASLAMSSKISTHHYTIISSGSKASLETQEQGL